MRGFKLGVEAARQVARVVRHAEHAGPTASPNVSGFTQAGIMICKTGGSGIAAMSGTTPGLATATVYRIDKTGDVAVRQNQDNSNVTITVYNLSQSAVAADTYIQVKQETISGKYLVDFEDCG